jgi:hypothetical protein
MIRKHLAMYYFRDVKYLFLLEYAHSLDFFDVNYNIKDLYNKYIQWCGYLGKLINDVII